MAHPDELNIKVGDNVEIVEGPNKGRSGVITEITEYAVVTMKGGKNLEYFYTVLLSDCKLKKRVR